MTIFVPDPFPGRCRNFRQEGAETVRCLDYEGIEHVCTFPKPKPLTGHLTSTATSYMARDAAPWVKP